MTEPPALTGFVPVSVSDSVEAFRSCLWCDYGLRGLAEHGRCPECGFSFGDEEASCEFAKRLFDTTFSRCARLGLDAAGVRKHPCLSSFARTLLAACAFSAAFVSLNIGASYAVAHLGPPVRGQRWNGFAEFGVYGTYGTLVRVSIEQSLVYMCYIAVHILLLSGSLAVYYRCRLRRSVLHGYSRRFRRLAWHAGTTAPAMLWIPLLLTGPWQLVNSSWTGGSSELHLHFPLLPRLSDASRYDDVSILALLMVLIALASGALVLRKHHRFLNELVCSVRRHAAPVIETSPQCA